MQAADLLFLLEIQVGWLPRGLNDLLRGDPPDGSGNPREIPFRKKWQKTFY